jgi:hypothetical protein
MGDLHNVQQLSDAVKELQAADKSGEITAALQSLADRVTALETAVAALQAKP